MAQRVAMLCLAASIGALLPDDGELPYDVAWDAQPKLPHLGMPETVGAEQLPQMVVAQSMPEAAWGKVPSWSIARTKEMEPTAPHLMQQTIATNADAAHDTHDSLPCTPGADGIASCIKSFSPPNRAAASDSPDALDDSPLRGKHPTKFIYAFPGELDQSEPRDFGDVQGGRAMNHALWGLANPGKQRPANEVLCDLGGCPNDSLGMVERRGPHELHRAVAMVAARSTVAAAMPERQSEEQLTGRPRLAMPEVAVGAAEDADGAGDEVAVGRSRHALLRRLALRLEVHHTVNYTMHDAVHCTRHCTGHCTRHCTAHCTGHCIT